MKLILISHILFLLNSCTSSEIYNIKEIKGHIENEGLNSDTFLVVWEEGNSGHVKEIICNFPPEDDPYKYKQVKVGKVLKKFSDAEKSFKCTGIGNNTHYIDLDSELKRFELEEKKNKNQ